MLVILTQPVHPRSREERVSSLFLILGDHLLSPAGIPGQRKTFQMNSLFQNAVFYKRRNQGDKSAGVAAGIGDSLCLRDFFPLSFDLRHAVNPCITCPVSGAGIDDNRSLRVDKGCNLFCGIIRQTQENAVGAFGDLFPHRNLMAKLIGDLQEFDVASLFQPFFDFESRGTGTAVDKYSDHNYPLYFSLVC